MTTERRTFRPFNVPAALTSFLADARLIIGGDAEEFIENGSRRRVDASELRSGNFSLEIARDDDSFQQMHQIANAAVADVVRGSVELAVIASSPYLKSVDVLFRRPISDVQRMSALVEGPAPRTFRAVHHGCDIQAYLLLSDALGAEPLKPWRKSTWLARARFQLRTSLEGLGWTILPLTDELRDELGLPRKTLRYTDVDESPLTATSATTVKMYVHDELLARLKKSPRRSWAKAFMDQLAVDALSAIALRALADREIHEIEWGAVSETLLGSLLAMVDGSPNSAAEDDRQVLLDTLRSDPLKFMALIEGAVSMRDSANLIVGDG